MEKIVTVLKICHMCHESHLIMLDPDQLVRIKAGESIQVVAPNLTADERELLISNTCGPCFDSLMPEPEEALDPVQEIMKDFLRELSVEEDANGSDLLARTFAGFADDVEQFESIKDVAAKVFETYFDFHMDKEAEGPIPDED